MEGLTRDTMRAFKLGTAGRAWGRGGQRWRASSAYCRMMCTQVSMGHAQPIKGQVRLRTSTLNCIQPSPKDMATAPPLHQPTASTMYDPADTNLEYVFKQWKDERVEEMGGTGASD